MPFPLSVSGRVTVRDVTTDEAVERVEDALRKANALALRREGGTLQFRGGLFRATSSFNVLLPISRGVVEVSPCSGGVSVRYRVTFTQMCIVVTLLAAFLVPHLIRAPVPLLGRVALLAFLWMWVVGANFVLTAWRFRSLLLRSVSLRRAA